MPTAEHEILTELFAQRPDLTIALLRAAHREVPDYTSLALLPGDFTQTMATEYRADRVVVLRRGRRKALCVVVEIQREVDEQKSFSWPLYQSAARAKHRCDAEVMVVSLERGVAVWARAERRVGSRSVFGAVVLGPDEIPRVTSVERAEALPELAVLSALAHGNEPRRGLRVVRAAIEAAGRLDEERGRLYADVILARLNEVMRQTLEAMMIKGYEYQSDFARKYYGQGLAEGEAKGEAKGEARGEARGKAEGEARAILAVLEARGLRVTRAVRAAVEGCTDLARLDAWVRAAVSVKKASDLLDSPGASPAQSTTASRRKRAAAR